MEREKTFFEKRIKPVLMYVGFIGAIILSIAYVVVVVVMINGFKVEDDVTKTITYSVVNALVGFMIMQFLKAQGESFAKNIPENKIVSDKFVVSKQNSKKKHSMKYYWVTSVIKDIFSKCVSIMVTTFGIIYIIIEGNHDYSLLGLAFVNLLLFLCFGLLSLVKTYDYYNDCYIPYLLEKLEEKHE